MGRGGVGWSRGQYSAPVETRGDPGIGDELRWLGGRRPFGFGVPFRGTSGVGAASAPGPSHTRAGVSARCLRARGAARPRRPARAHARGALLGGARPSRPYTKNPHTKSRAEPPWRLVAAVSPTSAPAASGGTSALNRLTRLYRAPPSRPAAAARVLSPRA